jgi:hypothetical protein
MMATRKFKLLNTLYSSRRKTKWNDYENLLSPNFYKNEECNEIYTPSFDNKDSIDFKNASPLSFIKQLKDVSAQKTAEPPYLRKRRNKFKQKCDDMPYIGHIMVNNEGHHIIQPIYHPSFRGLSVPPSLTLGNRTNSEEIYGRNIANKKDCCNNSAPKDNQYDSKIILKDDNSDKYASSRYPICRCQHYYANMCYNPYGYYAPAPFYLAPYLENPKEKQSKQKSK